MFRKEKVKKKLLAPENLLLACPLTLLLIRQFFTLRMILFEIHFHDTTIMMPVSQVLQMVFLVQVAYFFMHKLFRVTNKRNPLICNLHVITTQVCLSVVILLYFALEQYTANRIGNSPSEAMEAVLLRGSFSPAITWIGTAFIFLHILFLVYFLILMIATILTKLIRRKSF
jgi:hypothetical protein